MVRLFARHPVEDYHAWRKVYDDFDEERRGWGVFAQAVYQSVEDPNDVTLWHDFANADEARAFLSSARLHEVMAEAGVAGEPEIWLVTEA
jgi:hypothetical protein